MSRPALFLVGADAQTQDLLDRPEGGVAQGEHERERHQHADSLRDQLLTRCPSTGDPPFGSPKALYWASRGAVKQPARDRAPDTRQAVGRRCPDRIVHVLVDRDHAEHHDHAPPTNPMIETGPRLHVARGPP